MYNNCNFTFFPSLFILNNKQILNLGFPDHSFTTQPNPPRPKTTHRFVSLENNNKEEEKKKKRNSQPFTKLKNTKTPSKTKEITKHNKQTKIPETRTEESNQIRTENRTPLFQIIWEWCDYPEDKT